MVEADPDVEDCMTWGKVCSLWGSSALFVSRLSDFYLRDQIS